MIYIYTREIKPRTAISGAILKKVEQTVINKFGYIFEEGKVICYIYNILFYGAKS